MWPFSKNSEFAGVEKDLQGNWKFDLTKEEKQEVQRVVDQIYPGGSRAFEEMPSEMRRDFTAHGLYVYAERLVMKSRSTSKKNLKAELINREFASISKAYSLCQIPIYLYDLACLMEEKGESGGDIDACTRSVQMLFRDFLTSQNEYKPSFYQELLLGLQE